MSRKSEAEVMLFMAADAAAGWMDDVIASHEKLIQTMKARKAELEISVKAFGEVGSSAATPVNILSWAVNDVTNCQRNVRFDMVANHGAALAVTCNALKTK